jgi:hypothetical protein
MFKIVGTCVEFGDKILNEFKDNDKIAFIVNKSRTLFEFSDKIRAEVLG